MDGEIDVESGRSISQQMEEIFKDDNSRQPTRKQKNIMRDYYAGEEEVETVKVEKNGNNYIKKGNNKFKRVDKNEDVIYNPRNNSFYVQDSNGNFKSIDK